MPGLYVQVAVAVILREQRRQTDLMLFSVSTDKHNKSVQMLSH